MSKENFRQVLEKLVAKFDRNIDRYRDPSSSFNETQLRIEFIDPMFEALGWDMNNKAGAAEQYKEVIHEDKVYIEGKPKAPDYSFKFWGERKFFLEAKQPFVKIFSDYKPALQLRRYAWSAHLPVSILSDFEEFAVYDTTIEPKANDLASSARLKYYKYTDYLDKWEEIYDTFAKESIQQGSFDKYLAKEKRGSQLVDKVFLNEIESWREWLAKDLAKSNEGLTVEELNFAVQKIIDRIIFLRIAEDRGIETYKTLELIISNKNSYIELVKYFKKAQEKYNSGLFNFEEDQITPKLSVSDSLLDKILKHLYYPNSPYEFSVLGVELLGSIYEQFLGKVIRLTTNHNAIIEEKPEVKKAGGVYYTPQYIVDYIVSKTVGELVKDKTVKQAEKIKVLDPACGSGSFLIGAYSFLLDWHINEYEKLSEVEKSKLEKKGVIYKQVNKESSGISISSWQLTTNEKKRIMLNNIYGVDIDQQAVEVTKLSLALKMLENENQQSINQQMQLFAERILPDLSNNIKCGNSLISNDYWEDKDLSDTAEEEIRRVNAFNWKQEFQEIINNGGFDAVIGNPPYVRQELFSEFKPYYEKNYETYAGTADLYTYFIESGTKLINKNGYYSVIVANKWMRANFGESLRVYLQEQNILEIIDFGDQPVFQNATTYPCILTIKGDESDGKFIAVNVHTLNIDSLSAYIDKENFIVDQNELNPKGWSLINKNVSDLLRKLGSTSVKLEKYIGENNYRGVVTGFNDAFVISEETRTRLIEEDPSCKDIIKPFLQGKEVKRYKQPTPKKYLIFIPWHFPLHDDSTISGASLEAEAQFKKLYPSLYSHLLGYKAQLNARNKTETGVRYEWYALQRCAASYFREFDKNKIVYPNICQRPEFAFDRNMNYTNQKCFIIPLEDYFLLGVLNSSITHFWFETNLPKLRGGFYEPSWVIFKNYPIPSMNGKESETSRATIEKLSRKQLDLHASLNIEKSDTKRKILTDQISDTNKAIDKEVYRLYGLSEKEIKIVETVIAK